MADTLTSNCLAIAKDRLSRSRIFVLRRLLVLQDGDAILLRGQVDSYYHKQLAQELVRMAVEAYAVDVINEIDVVYQSEEEENFPRSEWA